ncbi:winged helix-turn-helix domain-containing protein [Pseudoalteromonas piratica]|uniref:OmpR/PhoB-type domain-containing protein n=1 Tax=Pseudoalteromonas piratica TaxID=1348114 RepID=A0A0A7ELH7_9GAMM|nr:winged helix-turn-helix domain-containing protein [Pseudoalteromonas piratica]AIY67525.1 hypothetical protein OM33_21145 [Pseudoalteromonas piratica]
MTNTLQSTDEQKSIDNKSMQVLLLLIENSGNNVSKEQIINHVWQGSVVNDEILSVSISKIRKALGDNARQPTFIKTIPNVGYCLISDVIPLTENTLSDEQPLNTVNQQTNTLKYVVISGILLLITIISIISFYANNQESKTQNLANISSIAVLPFEDLIKNKDNIYYAEGLSDAIINQLSQVKDLKVISRDSSFNFRANRDPSIIGDSLKVEALLDGNLQQSADQLRVNVRIISTFDGRLLWAKSFDNQDTNVFLLQDQISHEVRKAFQPSSVPQISASTKIDSQAYEWFLMAQYFWRQRTPTSLLKAETYFKHSLELEPNYVDAHIGLAITYGQFHYYANWRAKESVDKGLPHIRQALTLKPNHPMALAAKGMLLTLKASYSENPQPLLDEAQTLFVHSLELEDNATTRHWYSSLLNRMGKEALVIENMEHAIALNPLSASLKNVYSQYLAIRGKVDTAQKLYNRALILEPDRASRIIESTHIFRNTPNSINAIAKWHLNNQGFFEYCSSDEYCEQVVFAYLSIGLDKEANKILARMVSKHDHFKQSLTLINYGRNNELMNAVSLLKQLSKRYPNNYKYKHGVAIAEYRAGLYTQAKESLLDLYPQWQNAHTIDVTTDNYSALTLYGATLLKLNKQESADQLLNNVAQFLHLDKVQDKAQAEMVLAQIYAQLSKPVEAKAHLNIALNLGWLETFDREWWTLKDSHLLKPIMNQIDVKELVATHQENVKQLAKTISLEF